MTGPSHYVGGVELAIAELQEPLGVNADRPPLVISLEGVRTLCAFNARSDKTSLSGSFEPQQEFAPVRMLARRVDLTATCVAAAVAITDRAVPDTLRCGAVSSRTPNRRHIAKPTRPVSIQAAPAAVSSFATTTTLVAASTPAACRSAEPTLTSPRRRQSTISKSAGRASSANPLEGHCLMGARPTEAVTDPTVAQQGHPALDGQPAQLACDHCGTLFYPRRGSGGSNATFLLRRMSEDLQQGTPAYAAARLVRWPDHPARCWTA